MVCKQQFGFDDIQQGRLFDFNEALNLHVFSLIAKSRSNPFLEPTSVGTKK